VSALATSRRTNSQRRSPSLLTIQRLRQATFVDARYSNHLRRATHLDAASELRSDFGAQEVGTEPPGTLRQRDGQDHSAGKSSLQAYDCLMLWQKCIHACSPVSRMQGKLGNAAKYVTRTQAVKRLQLRLAEFRCAPRNVCRHTKRSALDTGRHPVSPALKQRLHGGARNTSSLITLASSPSRAVV
jgi:hypothetical protein